MTPYIERDIREIVDDDFQTMVTELCECVEFNPAEFQPKTFRFLLMAMWQENSAAFSLQFVGRPVILSRKVHCLPPNSVLYQVCEELARLNGLNNECFDNKNVLSLIKKCSKIFGGKPQRQRGPTRNQLRHEAQTNLIKQRRENGDL